MAEFVTRLVDRRRVAERTMSFYFEKPPGYTYAAGQFQELTLRDPPETDAEGNTRAFSASSAPHEDRVAITTRLRDTAFKRSLQSLPLGTELTLAGPFGELTLHPDAQRPAVFLAGGIGVTPFRSILVDAAHRRLEHSFTLFYSNRRREDAPFLNELQELARRSPRIRFVPTLSRPGPGDDGWEGERGHIDAEMIARHPAPSPDAVYYVAGPPKMVTGLVEQLRSAGVEDGHIRSEQFDGY